MIPYPFLFHRVGGARVEYLKRMRYHWPVASRTQAVAQISTPVSRS